MKTYIDYLVYFFLLGLTLTSCKTFLDVPPNHSLTIPNTVEEYERLLNNNRFYTSIPSIGDVGIDDYYLPTQNWASLHFRMGNGYIWAPDFYEGSNESGVAMDWNNPYDAIYHANVAIDGLKKLSNYDQISYNNVMGHALFLRGFQHYMLYQLYGQPYRSSSAHVDLGIPLRLTSDLEAPITRATVQETLDQIIDDLSEAHQLLPSAIVTQNKLWSSKAAAAAMLGRVYLTIADYERALNSVDACISYYSLLLDYNELPTNNQLPQPENNPEILFQCQQTGVPGLFTSTNTFVDTVLIGLYEPRDLRKHVFFKASHQPGRFNFNSHYSGNTNAFAGLAMDEVYLSRAECRARLGDEMGALEDLNHLLVHRYEQDTFTPLQLTNDADILSIILIERRKELILRNTRWSDLRRLNQDPRFALTLKRILDNDVYELPPNDRRYTLPIPPKEAQLSNLTQNER